MAQKQVFHIPAWLHLPAWVMAVPVNSRSQERQSWLFGRELMAHLPKQVFCPIPSPHPPTHPAAARCAYTGAEELEAGVLNSLSCTSLTRFALRELDAHRREVRNCEAACRSLHDSVKRSRKENGRLPPPCTHVHVSCGALSYMKPSRGLYLYFCFV